MICKPIASLFPLPLLLLGPEQIQEMYQALARKPSLPQAFDPIFLLLAIFPYSRRPQQSAADAFGLMIGSSTTFQSWQPASKTSTGKTALAESKQAGWRIGNLAREFVSASGLT